MWLPSRKEGEFGAEAALTRPRVDQSGHRDILQRDADRLEERDRLG